MPPVVEKSLSNPRKRTKSESHSEEEFSEDEAPRGEHLGIACSGLAADPWHAEG